MAVRTQSKVMLSGKRVDPGRAELDGNEAVFASLDRLVRDGESTGVRNAERSGLRHSFGKRRMLTTQNIDDQRSAASAPRDE